MAKTYVILIRNDMGRICFVEQIVSSDVPLSQAYAYLDYYRRNFGLETAESADIVVDDGDGVLVRVLAAT